MRRLRFAALALSLLLAVAACGDPEQAAQAPTGEDDAGDDDGSPDDAGEQPTEEQTVSLVQGDAGVQVTGEPGQEPDITVPGGEPPAELHYVDLIEGDGEEAQPGATVSTHYKGVFWSDGEQFDASWGRGEPTTFPLDGVIAGWTHGIPGMKIGGRRLLVIPSDLAYGEQGYPGAIPPNSALVFVIDLVALP